MDFFKDPTSSIDKSISDSMYPGLISEADGIDLRIELNRILYGSIDKRPLGHWVVVRLFDTSSRSKFFNKYTKEGINGPAHNYTDILIRTRRMQFKPTGNFLDNIKVAELESARFQYYFEYDVPIKIGDQIYTIDVADSKIKPTSYTLEVKHDIHKIHQYRLESGRVEYIVAIATINHITY